MPRDRRATLVQPAAAGAGSGWQRGRLAGRLASSSRPPATTQAASGQNASAPPAPSVSVSRSRAPAGRVASRWWNVASPHCSPTQRATNAAASRAGQRARPSPAARACAPRTGSRAAPDTTPPARQIRQNSCVGGDERAGLRVDQGGRSRAGHHQPGAGRHRRPAEPGGHAEQHGPGQRPPATHAAAAVRPRRPPGRHGLATAGGLGQGDRHRHGRQQRTRHPAPRAPGRCSGAARGTRLALVSGILATVMAGLLGHDAPHWPVHAKRVHPSRAEARESHDRGTGPHQALRGQDRRRPPVVPGGARPGDRVPRAERRRQVDHDAARCWAWTGRRRARATINGRNTPTSPIRCAPSARCSRPRRCTRAGAPAATCCSWPRPRACPAAGWTRCLTWWGCRDVARKRMRGLLAGHGPAGRHRRGDAGRPVGAAAGRAGQRARPRGDPVGQEPDEAAWRPRAGRSSCPAT